MKYRDLYTVEIMSGQEMYDALSSDINADMPTRLKYYDPKEGLQELHFVIKDGNKIVADAGVQENPYNDKQLWSKHFTVDPNYRNIGLATKLVDAVFDYASTHNYDLVRSIASLMGEKYLANVIDQAKEKYPELKVVDSTL